MRKFQRFLSMQEELLALRALEAEKEGYLGVKESAKLLRQLEKRIADESAKD